MKSSSYEPCFVSRLLQEQSHDAQSKTGEISRENELDIKWLAAAAYMATVAATTSTLHSFTLAMLKFPQVQRKAQEEIDRVVGHERLPSLQDRRLLPYADAIVKAALRWLPALPMGVPHVSSDTIF